MNNKELQFDRKRHRVKNCPCGKKNSDGKFVPYIGHEKNGYCHSCGETFLPEMKEKKFEFYAMQIPELEVSYHDVDLIKRCGRNFSGNHFVQYLRSLFELDDVKHAIKNYLIGTSKHWEGANIFWQIDDKNKVRHGKVMAYNKITGKRVKTSSGGALISSVRSLLKLESFNLKQCLFGLHLISENSVKTIALVEGEKTAVIMSIFKPEYVWMATGSKQGFKLDMLTPLKNYKIVAFPDKGEYECWSVKAFEFNEKGFDIKVDTWLESQFEHPPGSDLADVFVSKLKEQITVKNVISDQPKLVTTNAEILVHKLAEINPTIWNLIVEFDLVDESQNEIRRSN